MTERVLGKFETTHSNLMDIMTWATAHLDDRFDQSYLNLAEDELRTVANAGESVAGYNTLREPYVQDVELDDDVDGQAGVEAVVNVPNVLDYLNFVGGERVGIELIGGDDHRASKMRIDGDLSATIYLPSSEADYQSKALKIIERYDDEDKWVKSDGDHLDTSFTTTMEEIGRIVSVKEYDDFNLNNVPVVVNDGKFMLDASDSNGRDEVSGSLYAEAVEGPDVHNEYSRGIGELTKNISGKVRVATEPNSLLSIVRKSNDGAMILRYSILPVA